MRTETRHVSWRFTHTVLWLRASSSTSPSNFFSAEHFFTNTKSILILAECSTMLRDRMNTFEGTMTVIAVQAIVELILRQTITLRDRFVFVHLLRHSEKEADRRFGHPSYGAHRARVVLGEMVVEYGCIVIAPLTVLAFEPFRLFYNFGYTPGESVAVGTLLGSAGLQLAAEFLVDMLCVRSEEIEGIPVLEQWRLCNIHGNRTHIYVYAAGVAVGMAFFGMSAGFQFRMPWQCVPFPCDQCTAEGAGREFLTGAGSAAEWLHHCSVNTFNATST